MVWTLNPDSKVSNNKADQCRKGKRSSADQKKFFSQIIRLLHGGKKDYSARIAAESICSVYILGKMSGTRKLTGE